VGENGITKFPRIEIHTMPRTNANSKVPKQAIKMCIRMNSPTKPTEERPPSAKKRDMSLFKRDVAKKKAERRERRYAVDRNRSPIYWKDEYRRRKNRC